jgi:hypothetical protein
MGLAFSKLISESLASGEVLPDMHVATVACPQSRYIDPNPICHTK